MQVTASSVQNKAKRPRKGTYPFLSGGSIISVPPGSRLHNNDFSDGVTLTNNVLNINESGFNVKNKTLKREFINNKGEREEYVFNNLSSITSKSNFIGFLSLDNRTLPEGKVNYRIEYELLRDNQGNHKLFEIKNETVSVNPVNEVNKSGNTTSITVSYLVLKTNV